MQLLTYLLTYPILWLISILPYRLFYWVADFFFLLVYHVVGYRKKVVLENLKLAFPDREPNALRQIRKEFYRHLCDVFLESVKMLSLNKRKLGRRFQLQNASLIQDLVEHKSVLLLLPHYANWEWNTSLNIDLMVPGYAVYQKIGNRYFDRLMQRVRAKWNTQPITQKETVKTIVKNENEGIIAVYGMVSDQSPLPSKTNYWSPFMGVTVPIFNGPEQLARKLDLAVVFAKVSKIRRGYYTVQYIPITQNGKQTKEGEITEQFLRLTETQIKEAPAYYLWTHRRWKHRDKVPASKRN